MTRWGAAPGGVDPPLDGGETTPSGMAQSEEGTRHPWEDV